MATASTTRHLSGGMSATIITMDGETSVQLTVPDEPLEVGALLVAADELWNLGGELIPNRRIA